MSPQTGKGTSQVAALLLLFLLIALVGALLFAQIDRSHRVLRAELIDQTEVRGMQLAEAIGGQLDGLLSSIDLGLQQLRQEWLRDPADFDEAVLRTMASLPGGAATHVSVADAEGLIVYNSLGITQETRVNDRPHFRIHLAGGDRLVVGDPVQSRLLDGEWVFIVNRPILDGDRFAGTINMSASSRHIAERLRGLSLSVGDIISMVGSDGTFLARSHDFQSAMTQRLPADRPFLLPDASRRGTFSLVGQVDGIERIYAWYRIEPYGPFAVVGLSLESVFQAFEPVARRDYVLGGVLIVALAVLGGAIVLLLVRVVRQQRDAARYAEFRRSIFDNSPVPVLVAEANSLRFIDCNPAGAAMLGLPSREAALGQTILDFSPELQPDGGASAQRFSCQLGRLPLSGSVRFEWRQKRRSGEQWDADLHILGFTQDGRDLLQLTLGDISERERAKQALATSEERLRQAMRTSRIGLFDHDHETGAVYWSPELREMYGIAPGEPFTLADRIAMTHPADCAMVESAVAQAHDPAGDGLYDLTYRIVRRDGQLVWLTARAQTSFRGDGPDRHPYRTVGAVMDISKHRQAEAELRQTNAILSAVQHAQSQFMARLSPHAIFNDLLLAILEITDSEYGFIGESLHADDGSPYLKAHGITNIAWNDETRRFYDENAPSGLDFHNLDNLFGRVATDGALIIANDPAADPRSTGTPPGHPPLKAFMGTPFFDGDRLLGIIALANRPGGYDESLLPLLEPITTAIRNIIASLRSERLRQTAERELVQLNVELESRVEERTAKMREAMQEAERANAAKSEFLSRMSHELRTPLNAILGFSQLLEQPKETPLDADQIESVREIQLAGQHLLVLVNEVLDLARIESGRLEISVEPVALPSAIAQCATQIEPAARGRDIRLTVRPSASLTVLADPTRLKQVLLNLLSNAVKYNRVGGTIEVSSVLVEGGRVRIDVSDSGRGLSADQQARLFRPFERLESAYEGIEGAGIGLALAKQLVVAMQGRIGVDSAPGHGSTFWFELPLSSETASGETASPSGGLGPLEKAGEVSETVLYIEDNPTNLRLVQKILAKHGGVELLAAHTPELGIELALSHRPALILLDINLPGMDGYQVLERFKAEASLKDTPVIAITANAMKHDMARGEAAGFTDYLTKPFEIQDFLDRIERCLASRKRENL